MHNCKISHFNILVFTVVASLTIAVVFSLSSSTSINSQPENDSRSLSFDNKCPSSMPLTLVSDSMLGYEAIFVIPR